MSDRLWKRAKDDLCVRVADMPPDPLVWEHSRRVARLAEAVMSLPDVQADNVDKLALTAAALYHDAGWVIQARTGELAPHELLLRPTPDLLLELAADQAAARLDDIVPAASLQTAVRAIRACNDRNTDLPEAQILAEADNLDQIGPQTICLMLRKQRAEGKTLDDLVAAWQRQEEYHYWQARIKESFRFASVRSLAERRWQALRQFMNELRTAIQLEDLAELGATPAPKGRAPRPTRA